MKFLIIYMLVSTMILAIAVATGFCGFEWSTSKPSFTNVLVTLLYTIIIILVWPIVVLIFIINGRRDRK